MENSLVGSLGLSICLRMSDGGKSMLDMELVQEFLEPPIVKLSAILCNDHPGETIPAYYKLLDERLGLGLGDVGHWLGLYPFGK